MDKSGNLRKLQNDRSYEERFRSLYRDSFQDLFIYAESIIKSEDLAKDAVAEVFVKLWDSKNDFKKIKNIRSYLIIAVKNECLKLLNQTNRLGKLDTSQQIEIINPEEILLEKELLKLIDEVITSLPKQCQLIFEMSSKHQMNYKEIATELNITTSTVGTQLSRAIHAIRTEIILRYKDSDNRDNINYLAKSVLPLAFSIFPGATITIA